MNNKNLPSKWIKTTLGEVFTWMSGGTPARSNSSYYGGNIPWVTITDLNDGLVINTHNYLTDIAIENSSAKLIPANSVMIGLYGSIGKLGIAGRELTTNQAIASAIPNFKEFNSKFLFYYLAYSKQNLAKLGSGVTQKNIYISNLKEYEFYLPPFQEQKRITDKIDELFSELDNGIEELETAQKKLELYRQSLLKSAVEGELSKEWCETQTEVSETGEQLLARILKERREHWEQEKLKEFAEKGKNPPKNWQDKYPKPVQPYDSINLPKLPENWTWASLDQLAYPIRNGMSPKPNTEQKGYPILRINAVRAMKVYLDECRHLDLPYEEVKNFILKNNDILITRYNGSIDLLGVFGVVRDLDEPMLHPDKLIRAQPILGEILSNWIELAANIGHSRAYVKSRAKTTSGQTGVSGEDIKQTPIALPPLAEQLYLTNLISLELENMSNQFDSLEITLKQASNQKLNILKDAFTGKLVPQDPNDEPAQVLLERIQKQREAEALVKKSSTKKRSTSKAKKEVVMSQTILEILQQQSDWISGQALATAFGLGGNSKIEEIEQFYEQLRALSLDDKIMVKPDQQNKKEQDLIKLKDKTDAS